MKDTIIQGLMYNTLTLIGIIIFVPLTLLAVLNPFWFRECFLYYVNDLTFSYAEYRNNIHARSIRKQNEPK
jgi:hypothetical protein